MPKDKPEFVAKSARSGLPVLTSMRYWTDCIFEMADFKRKKGSGSLV
jgi:hypothetical protein